MKKIGLPEVGLASAFGLFGYFVYRKKTLEKQFKNIIIQEAMNYLKNDTEIFNAFGRDFIFQTTLYATLMSSIKLDGQYGEIKLFLKTPSGTFDLNINSTSQTYGTITTSKRKKLFKAKFFIPDQTLIDRARSEEDPDSLKKEKVPNDSKFWSLDFISITNSNNSFIRKPSNKVLPDNESSYFPNFYAIYTFMQNSDKKAERKINFEELTAVELQKLRNFRTYNSGTSRILMMKYALFFYFIFYTYYLVRKAHFNAAPITNTFLEEKAMNLISKRFGENQTVIFNNTSLGGKKEKSAEFRLQFTTRNTTGIGHFKAHQKDEKVWGFTKAELRFQKKGDPAPVVEDLFKHFSEITAREKEEEEIPDAQAYKRKYADAKSKDEKVKQVTK